MNDTEQERNYYDVLGLHRNASADDIKAQYKKLVLKSHPDKQMQNGTSESAENFLELDEAWKVLSDPLKKQEYDAYLTEAELGQSAPIQFEIKLGEMTFCEESGTYTLDCRCGGYYQVTDAQLEEGFDLIPCSTCTLLGLVT